jgi:hypothetical protein
MSWHSVFTTVLSNRLSQTIPEKVPPALVAAGLPAASVPSFLAAITAGTASAFQSVAGLTPQIQAIGFRAYQEANAAAFSTVFLSTLGFSGVGIILTFFTPNVDHLLTGDVNITIQDKNAQTVAGTHGGGPHKDVSDVEKA